MKEIAAAIAQKYLGVAPLNIIPLGGGFYGRVFLAEMPNEPTEVIIKVYLFPHLAQKEACQLKILSTYSIVKMPEVLLVHKASPDIANDAIIMEYIPGLNAGDDFAIKNDDKVRIANQIVENLLSYHKIVNSEGFGEIGANSFEPDWKKWYKNKADGTLLRAKSLYNKKKINEYIFSVVQKAHELYDKIFYIPITEARLIHGDYNTWNILLDEDLTHVSAVIDPFNCCWADSELDLYQLNNANGKQFGLLDIYASKSPLSENFPLKLSFYELFSEITHFYDANVEIDYPRMTAEANELELQMKVFGLL
ncbi:MAG: fructosamine kinase family protein [Oscillospiraceae bacterium]|nr:fructosamine kinase family protein [Oscillospiraceae bacterium]